MRLTTGYENTGEIAGSLGYIDGEDSALDRRVLAALAFLQSRGLNSADLIEEFRLGYANRALSAILPSNRLEAGIAVRRRLRSLGFLRASGHELFAGAIVTPVLSPDGTLLQVIGTRIGLKWRSGSPLFRFCHGHFAGCGTHAHSSARPR